jgi:hypothetical protein
MMIGTSCFPFTIDYMKNFFRHLECSALLMELLKDLPSISLERAADGWTEDTYNLSLPYSHRKEQA